MSNILKLRMRIGYFYMYDIYQKPDLQVELPINSGYFKNALGTDHTISNRKKMLIKKIRVFMTLSN
jgi:hypothetical protein